jgi:hypothetical protein
MKTICIFFVACTIISLPAYSWDYTGNYEDIPTEEGEDVSTIQTPAIIETVKVGGFTLDMDRVETGFYMPRQAQGNFLGEFRGDGFDIRVFRIPHSGQLLAKVATESNRKTGDIVKVAEIGGYRGVHGIRVEYYGKPTFVSSNIHDIRYYFVNRSGETICFDAQSTKPSTDWSIVDHLISGTITPSRS